MVTAAGLEPRDARARLADPTLRRAIELAVKRRVPGEDAEDVVQAALADLLSARRVPEDAEEFRRFVFAVTRNKVFDHFRRRAREAPEEEAMEPAATEARLSAQDILRWAEAKLPDSDARHTLEWMLREGDGEKLEQIARDVNLPAPRVRQRVSRLRRFLRERWAAELMLALLALALLIPPALFYYEHHHHAEDVAKRDPELQPEPAPAPEQRGRELRRVALEHCQKNEAEPCLEGLDRARLLDPKGDAAPEVENARRAAAARLAPVPSALTLPSANPLPRRAPQRPMPTKTSETSSLAPTATSRPQRSPSITLSDLSDVSGPSGETRAHKPEPREK